MSETTDSLQMCQGSRYNRSCPGGQRLCRRYEDLWLCLKKCWPRRKRIAEVAERTRR